MKSISEKLRPVARSRFLISLFLVPGILFAPGAALASSVIPGVAADFTVLGLAEGSVIINSATSITGNVGYSDDVISNTNQKVDSFTGTAYVHSGATFNHTSATFDPSGGILTGTATDSLLEQANIDAIAASAAFAALTPTHTALGDLGDNDNRSLTSTGDVNVFSLTSLNYKEDLLELIGLSGAENQFIFNVSGDFDFDNSEIRLTGVLPEHVVFNFLIASDINIGKAGSIFLGAILAPTGSVDYHNPASFIGSIIAKDINLHSDFNIAGVSQVPVPGAILLFASGLLGLSFLQKKPRPAKT